MANIPVKKAEEYIERTGIVISDENSVKQVFDQAINEYFQNKISQRLFSGVCEVLRKENQYKIDITDLELISAIEAGSELKGSEKINTLREYFSKIH